jgi:hypothetical protein
MSLQECADVDEALVCYVPRMKRRAFLLASVLTLPPLLTLSPRADAATARLITLEQLVERSTYVVVATAGEQSSAWEDLPSGRRIVTYTRLTVERAVTGAPGAELWVRTLGGVVDHIGQAVPGEAALPVGSRSLLFLVNVGGVVVVTAMAQGRYPVVADEKGTARLTASPDAGLLLPRPGPTVSAQERLVGGTVEAAVTLVKQIQKARDEQK